MSNIHGLHSDRPRSPSPSSDDNNRYVGGVDSRGGGSGLAVEPNPLSDPLFNIASSTSTPSATRRTITMYRDGFTVDSGPYRRLNDPANAEFLSALARGRTPRELEEESGGDIQVGLVDKRNEEYEEGGGSSAGGFASFSGAGEALGGSGQESTEGVVDPSDVPENKEEGGNGSVCVRLLNGKRLVVKIDADKSVRDLARRINASGMAGSESYVLVAGFPPKPVKDLSQSVKAAGLIGANVTQKRSG